MPEDRELLIINKIKGATVGNTSFINVVLIVSKMQVEDFVCENSVKCWDVCGLNLRVRACVFVQCATLAAYPLTWF